MKINKTEADGTIGLALCERIKVVIRDTFESVDGDGDTAQKAHSWSDREEHDGYELRNGSESNIPSHGSHQGFPS